MEGASHRRRAPACRCRRRFSSASCWPGLETVGVADEYVIESVFAVIKARRADGVPTWFVRSSEMKLNPEERLGALEGYAATVRQNLADTWKW